MTENNPKTRINRLSLGLNVILVALTVFLAADSVVFESLFYGVLSDDVRQSTFQQDVNGSPMYPSIFRYEHLRGRAIDDVSIVYRVQNTGAVIDVFELDLGSLPPGTATTNRLDDSTARVDISAVRPNEQFEVRIYTRNRADIEPTVVMSNGHLDSESTGISIGAVFIIVLIVIPFLIGTVFYHLTMRSLRRENERVIAERNALQEMYLSGKRRTTK